MKAEKKLNGECMNIAHGERTKIKDVKKMIEKYTGKKLALEVRPARVGDVLHTFADISKAKKLIGYKPKIYFEDGLKIAVKWYQSRVK